MTHKAVFFDLDGTLVDSIPDLAHASNAMLGDLNLPALPFHTLKTFVGKGTDVLIKRAISGKITFNEPDPHLFTQAKKYFHSHYHACNGLNSTLYPNVIQGLTTLHTMGLTLAVITNKPEEFTLPLLAQTGLLPFFELVVSGDTCPRKKPHPDQLIYACETLKVNASQTLFVGDSSNDAQAAKAAGIEVLILPYGYNEGHAIATIEAKGYIDTIACVPHWISRP